MKRIDSLRKTAGEFHSGQHSGLYSFASSGHVSQEAINEASEELNAGEIVSDRRGNWYYKHRYSRRNRAKLLTLVCYLQRQLNIHTPDFTKYQL
jgi:6-phosphogluconate dehydrogenase (decarboxylating)